jgi:hypothetical protein
MYIYTYISRRVNTPLAELGHCTLHHFFRFGSVAPDPQQAGTSSQSIEVSKESLMVSEQLELHQPRAQVRQCAGV